MQYRKALQQVFYSFELIEEEQWEEEEEEEISEMTDEKLEVSFAATDVDDGINYGYVIMEKKGAV